MAYDTFIAAFVPPAWAMKTIEGLQTLGLPDGEIKRHLASSDGRGGSPPPDTPVFGQGSWSWLFGEGPLEMDQGLLDRALRNGGTVISVRMMGEKKAGSGRGRGTRPIGHPGSKLQKPSVSRRCPGAGLTASSKR